MTGKGKKPGDTEIVKHVRIELKSKEGCTFIVNSDIEYSLFPPELIGFHGTISILGSRECPVGNFTFSANGDTDDDGNVTALYYSATSTEALSFLTQPESDIQIRAALSAAMQ